MQYSDHALNVLTAKTYKKIGRAWIVQHLSKPENLDKIITLLNRKLNNTVTREDFMSKKENIAAELEKNFLPTDGCIAIGDPQFPQHRGKVNNSEKPVLLFYRGNIDLLGNQHLNIAVIGLREPDLQTQEIEKNIVQSLVKQKAVIVSGLAIGCDSIAHCTTLENQGKTIAILPSPLYQILPTQNISLAEEIVTKGGLLISEYDQDFKASQELRGRYQERDRLQALFSDYIILAASYAKSDQGKDSGSRLAMEFAKNYQIPRAVIYEADKHDNNEHFNLNREILAEDSSVFKLNYETIEEFIQKIKAIKNISHQENAQQSLF